MNRSRSLACAGLLLASVISSAGASAPDAPHDPHGCAPDWHGPGGAMRGPGFGPPGPGLDFDRPPPYLKGLALTEAQQDKLFAILHAAAPDLRERAKAVRKAHEALHALAQSANYADSEAAALAQALGTAEGQLALVRIRTDRQVFLMLTPEQRAQAAEKEKERP